MATNSKQLKPLDIPFKEFMPGQVIQSVQFNDDMRDIEDTVNELVGQHNIVSTELSDHVDNLDNPHQVDAHQTGTYYASEIDEFFQDVKSGNLYDNAITNRVLDDECVDTRNYMDNSITASKLDISVGNQIDISKNISITDKYTKDETDELIRSKVGEGTYSKDELDTKFEQVQAGQILDKSISINQLKDDVGRRLDISNNPDILNKYTRDEVDLLLQNNALPRDWGSILEEDNNITVIPTKEITLPVVNHMKVGTFTVSESSILDVDIQENVDARGEYNTVGERLDNIDSQIKDNMANHTHAEYTNLKKNSAIGVAEIIDVAKSYYSVRYKNDGTPRFLYDTSHTPLGGKYNPSDSTYAGAIDCSTYIGLVLRGIPVEKSPYSHLLDSTTNDKGDNLEGNDTGTDIGDDEGNPETTLDPKLIRENKNDYNWAINPFEWKIPITDNSTPTPVRRASQLAQWMCERGMSIPLDETFSNIEPGDIIFWAKKDANGNYVQPNRYKHISHVAICVNKMEPPVDDSAFPSEYPYKHTMLEVTTKAPYVLNRTLEKTIPHRVVMVCRPDLGGLTTEQYAGNIATSLGITNISELYRPGTYYLTSSITKGLPNGVENGKYLALRVERTLTRQGKVYSLIQTLVNTYTNETVYRRTQYCYSHKPNSTSWTPWKSASDIVTLPKNTTENDIYALGLGLYVIQNTITFTADSSIKYDNVLTSVPSLYNGDLIWIKEQPSNKYIHCLTNGVRYTISSSNTISKVRTTDDSYVGSVNKDIPEKTIIEDGKLYLAKSDGTKIDSGTTLPIGGDSAYGGTNDWRQVKILGDVDSTDISTICGELNNIIDKIQTNCPKATIVIIPPIHRQSDSE